MRRLVEWARSAARIFAARIFAACNAAWIALLSFVLASLVFPSQAVAQPLPEQTIILNGETLHYAIRVFPAGVNVIDPTASLEPVSALDTAKLLNRFLTTGNIEDAALLSNSPRRRFEVLRDYKDSVGDDGFKEVFTQYFNPGNHLLAEVIMGSNSLLVWQLGEPKRIAGQYYVTVEGKVLMDDVPNEPRAHLRRVLEAIRSGRLPLPPQ